MARVCPICTKGFATPAELAAHKKARHGAPERRYECMTCKLTFASLGDMTQHMRTAHPAQ